MKEINPSLAIRQNSQYKETISKEAFAKIKKKLKNMVVYLDTPIEIEDPLTIEDTLLDYRDSRVPILSFYRESLGLSLSLEQFKEIASWNIKIRRYLDKKFTWYSTWLDFMLKCALITQGDPYEISKTLLMCLKKYIKYYRICRRWFPMSFSISESSRRGFLYHTTYGFCESFRRDLDTCGLAFPDSTYVYVSIFENFRKRCSESEKDELLEKIYSIIENNMDVFTEGLCGYNLKCPYIHFMDFQAVLQLTKEFIERNSEYFLIEEVLANESVREDLELKKLCMKNVLESNLNEFYQILSHSNKELGASISDDSSEALALMATLATNQ
jgi:hypothetical protein